MSDLQTYGTELVRRAAQRVSSGIVTGPDWSNSNDELACLQAASLLRECADEIERLRAEVAGLREDAERYRHMRNNSQFQSRNGPGLYWFLPRYGQGDEGEQLDAAIDAALAARKGEA